MKKPVVQNKIKLEKFLVKNLNFSCDQTTSKEDQNQEELKLDINVKSAFKNENKNTYLIFIQLKVQDVIQSLNIECEAVGVFLTDKPIDEDFKESPFVRVNSPAILFPYLRSYITTITANSGLSPIILPSINFVG